MCGIKCQPPGANVSTSLRSFTFCRASTLAQTLVSRVRADPSLPPKTRTWVCETFDPSDLIRSVMAFHVIVFAASWLASSCMENIFNIWKKFNKAKISRSLLCETLQTLLDLVERRLNADAIMLQSSARKNQFIDMRVMVNEGRLADENGAQKAKRRHKKKLSTFQLFSKERAKLQDQTCCPWSSAIQVADKPMWLLEVSVHGFRSFTVCLQHSLSVHCFFLSPCVWNMHSVYTVCHAISTCVCALTQFVLLLQEKKEAKGECPAYTIIHLVDLTGFEWRDSETNCPPKCLTCPVYLKGYTPCIGILTVLSNVSPIQVPDEQRPASVSLWLGKTTSLCKPEVFHNRWRTDKDPTQHLTKYSLIPPRVHVRSVH